MLEHPHSTSQPKVQSAGSGVVTGENGIFNPQGCQKSLKKAQFGDEYQQAPEHRFRGGLYRIEMEGTRPKPQIDFTEQTLCELRDRGFRDTDKVLVHIEGLSYRNAREANYDDVKWGID